VPIGDGLGREVERSRGRLREVVHGEHVAHDRLGLEAEEDVVPEDELAADRLDVAGHAVVLGAHPLGGQEGELRAPERADAALVQILGAAGELLSLLEEAPTDDVVAAPFEVFRAGLFSVGRAARLLC
jgi:hypothetical protein